MEYFKSRLHRMIGSLDPQKVEQYRELASSHDIDQDHRDLLRFMLEEELSPYEAVVRMMKSGLHDRSLRQLHRIAKEEQEALYVYFGWPTIDDLWADLLVGKEVELYPDEIEPMLAKCRQHERSVAFSMHLVSDRLDMPY